MKIFNTKLYILEEMTQEDLNNLALERNTLAKENARLKDKIERAIEYIKNIDKYEETLNDDTRVYMIQDVDVDEIERILKEN